MEIPTKLPAELESGSKSLNAERRFEQHLDHERAVLTVRANTSAFGVSLELWVDKLQHVVRIKVEASRPLKLTASLFLWRGDAVFAPNTYAVTDARYDEMKAVLSLRL